MAKGELMECKGCISLKDHLFGISVATQKKEKETKLKIAQKLHRLTNLPLKKISIIVELPIEEIQRHIRQKE